jgi:hypothetical protein
MVFRHTLEIDQVLLNVRVGRRNGKQDVGSEVKKMVGEWLNGDWLIRL